MFKVKDSVAGGFSSIVTEDWRNMILLHPDNFDAVLYRPVEKSKTTKVNANNALFGSFDDVAAEYEYQDPVIIKAVESTSQDDEFLSNWTATENIGYGASQSMILRLSVGEIANGSAIEFLTQSSDGKPIIQSWYIHHSVPVGKPQIGSLHYAIPCGDVEGLSLPDSELENLFNSADDE